MVEGLTQAAINQPSSPAGVPPSLPPVRVRHPGVGRAFHQGVGRAGGRVRRLPRPLRGALVRGSRGGLPRGPARRRDRRGAIREGRRRTRRSSGGSISGAEERCRFGRGELQRSAKRRRRKVAGFFLGRGVERGGRRRGRRRGTGRRGRTVGRHPSGQGDVRDPRVPSVPVAESASPLRDVIRAGGRHGPQDQPRVSAAAQAQVAAGEWLGGG